MDKVLNSVVAGLVDVYTDSNDAFNNSSRRVPVSLVIKR